MPDTALRFPVYRRILDDLEAIDAALATMDDMDEVREALAAGLIAVPLADLAQQEDRERRRDVAGALQRYIRSGLIDDDEVAPFVPDELTELLTIRDAFDAARRQARRGLEAILFFTDRIQMPGCPTVEFLIPKRQITLRRPSIPFEAVTVLVTVRITPPLPAGQSLKVAVFTPKRGAANRGKARVVPGQDVVTGAGGQVPVRGTAQTSATGPGGLGLRAVLQGAPMPCKYTSNLRFSVCAHPDGATAGKGPKRAIGRDRNKNLEASIRTTMSSDSGKRKHLDEVRVAPRTGTYPAAGIPNSPFRAGGAVGVGGRGKASVPVTGTMKITAFPQGTKTAGTLMVQHDWTFGCKRCKEKNATVPESGFNVNVEVALKPNPKIRVGARFRRLPAATTRSAPGSGGHTTPYIVLK